MKLTASALEFHYSHEDVREILEEYVRNQLARANTGDVMCHRTEDGDYIVAVWNDGASTTQMGEPVVLSEWKGKANG